MRLKQALDPSAYPQHAATIFRRAIRAVDPARLIQRSIDHATGEIRVGELKVNLHDFSGLYVIAIGKAAAGMTHSFLERSPIHPKAGLIALPAAEQASFPPTFKVFRAGHPVPTRASIQAGEAARSMLAQTREGELLVALVSGGGSALLELPLPGMGLRELQKVNQLLLASGLSISEMNVIRSALSQIKSGGLARIAYPARCLSLILSDVVSGKLGSIASGPTVLLPEQRSKARQILLAGGLWLKLPKPVRSLLVQPVNPPQKARRPINFLIGGNQQLLDAAVEAATSLGFQTSIISHQMQGEARQVGQQFARRMLRYAAHADQPACYLMGGETTVTLRGSGSGGRNQELALSAARILQGHVNIALASLASDGIDGPTDAAGAVVDGNSWERIKAQGLDPEAALERNDSYPALESANALYQPGVTGTNVADLVIGLIYPRGSPPSQRDPARV